MSRLNVVSGAADAELDAIRNTLDSFHEASCLDDLLAILRVRANGRARIEQLDAIGHSCSRGFLVLGTWVIDDSPQTAATFSQLLRPLLEQLGVRTIRLLGCSTATTERGIEALSRIAHASRCIVFGTRRLIGLRDYGPAGFHGEDALVDITRCRGRGLVIREHSGNQDRSS